MNSVFLLLTSGLLSFGIYNESKGKKPSLISTRQTTIKQVFISDWEKDIKWSSSDQLFYFKRPIPQLDQSALNDGVVLTYVKGYNFSNLPMSEKPMALPFQYFTPDETYTQALTWQVEKNIGAIEIGIQMNGELVQTFNKYHKNIQLRYFVLTPEFLQQKKLSKDKLSKITYNEIVALTGINP